MIAKRPKPRTGGGMKLPTKKVRAPRPQDSGGGMRPTPVGKKPGGPLTPSQDTSKLLASSRSGLGKSRTGGTGGTRKKVGGLSNRMNQRLALQRKLANQRRTARPIKGLGNAGRRRRIV